MANTRPSDPIAYLATYLYNYANTSRDIMNGTQVSEILQNHNAPLWQLLEIQVKTISWMAVRANILS